MYAAFFDVQSKLFLYQIIKKRRNTFAKNKIESAKPQRIMRERTRKSNEQESVLYIVLRKTKAIRFWSIICTLSYDIPFNYLLWRSHWSDQRFVRIKNETEHSIACVVDTHSHTYGHNWLLLRTTYVCVRIMLSVQFRSYPSTSTSHNQICLTYHHALLAFTQIFFFHVDFVLEP